MPDLLLELFSEEIPARMQRRAAEDLRKLVTDALVERGFVYEGARAFATPRRLALNVVGLPPKGKDVREERKGPRVGAPEKAIEGFLKSAGLTSLDEARIEKDPKKGAFYVAAIERPGRPTPQVLAEILPAIIRDFPWPKSMRWGAASAEPGSLRWVRPLHAIVCTFGPETETPEVVAFEVDGIRAGDLTQGHRFMAPALIQVRRFADYVVSLEKARVVLDAARRKDIILNEAKNLAFAKGLELVEDEGLLDEVAGLVEWPVVLVGSFEEAFLDIPPEVIRATIRANQKCFVLRANLSQGERSSAAEGGVRVRGELSPDRAEPLARTASAVSTSPSGRGDAPLSHRFILVANLDATDGGAAIVAGNERVARARLSDAKFFFETDKKVPLEDRLEKLKKIVFHEKLGTQYERIERIAALAKELAPLVGADPAKAERAARLAKADLVTEMVGEFPELQGLMGRYYAALQGEDASVAAAIEEHYKPLGPSDRVPTDPVSVAVALADKLDTLVGFWAIDEKPTGSKDPYALRRAALGVIRLVLENGIRFNLTQIGPYALYVYLLAGLRPERDYTNGGYYELVGERPEGKGVTGGKWHEAPYRYYLNFDGFIDEKGPSAAAAELGVADRDEEAAYAALAELRARVERMEQICAVVDFVEDESSADRLRRIFLMEHFDSRLWKGASKAVFATLLPFFADRLKVHLREQGARHDLIDAVFALGASSPLVGEAESRSDREGGRAASAEASLEAPAADAARTASTTSPMPTPPTRLGLRPSRPSPPGGGEPQDDLLMIVRRVEALGRFLDTEDGRNLLAGYRRAANILRIEEKKDSRPYDTAPDIRLLQQPEELALWEGLVREGGGAREAVAREDFEGAMLALSRLRAPVDAFFDKVTVNTDDPQLRENRLKLLNALRAATREVADFSKIEG